MRRFPTIGALLCALAIWVQALAPVAAMSMHRGADPLSAICSSTVRSDDGKPASIPRHDHQHCLLCHAYLGAAPVGARPVFTTLDFPIASTKRWQRVDLGIERSVWHRIFEPRGPPA